jgi:hypothetical protein
VGTMELSKKKNKSSREQQHVIIAAGNNLFDDASVEGSKEERPWEKALSKRKGPKMKKSTLGANIAIVEEPEGSEENDDDAMDAKDMFGSDLGFGAMDTFDSFGAFGETPPSMGVGKNIDDEDGEEEDSDNDNTTRNEDQADSPKIINSLSLLESTLANNDEPDGDDVNFDDMWDTLSADVSTAQEYERKQRENFRRKKGKTKYERVKIETVEEESEKKAKSTKNLHLFENEKGDDSKRKKKEHMSNEFLSAIREVFDEESEESEEDEASVSENMDDSAGEMDDEVSVVSDMYVGGEKSDKDEESVASGAADEDDAEEKGFGFSSDDRSNARSRASSRSGKRNSSERSRASARSSGRRSTTSARSHRSATTFSSRSSKRSSHQPKTPKVNPAEILEAELKRQGGSKLMSISSLKQEMNDRRGTSVKLLQKEYDQRKRQKEKDAIPSGSDRGSMHQIDFGNSDKKNLGVESFGFDKKSAKQVDCFFGEDMFISKVTPKGGSTDKPSDKPNDKLGGLSGHLSRWDAAESVTELDDLKTVQLDIGHGAGSGIMFGLGGGMGVGGLAHAQAMMASSLPDGLPAGMSVGLPGMPAPILPTLPGDNGKPTDNSPFAIDFDAMPLTMVAENFDEDDDNEMGLLASNDDWMDNDDNESTTKKKGNRRLSLMKLKGPKLGGGSKGPQLGGSLKKIGNFIPKRGSSSKKTSGGSVSSWGMGDDDDDASCLLGS